MTILALYVVAIPATLTAGALFGHAMGHRPQGELT